MSTSTILEQAVTVTASSASLATASMNPVYSCPRDNGMYYSDTAKRVYQLLCSTNELDSNLGMNYQPELQSCVDSCGSFTGCIGVSYTATSGSCSYKSSVLNRVGSSTSDSAILADYICPGADGTRLVDSSGSVYEILCNTFFPTSSNITSSLATSDLASCSEICSSTVSCSGFTFQNGSCTLVSNRNSNDRVLRMNVATAILIAKRVAQVASSGVAPYRSTSLVRSLPVDVSRTPSSTTQNPTITPTTSAGVVQISLSTSAVERISTTSSSPGTVSETSLTTESTTAVLPYTIHSGNIESTIVVTSSQDVVSASSPLSSKEQAAAGAATTSGTAVISFAAASTSSTSTDHSVRSSLQSLPTEDMATTIKRSSQSSTASLTPLPSVTSSSSPAGTSRASVLTNTALISSTLSSGTSNGDSGTLRPTTSGLTSSFGVASSSDAAISSPDNVATSILSTTSSSIFSTASSSVLETVSYSPESSGSPPQTSYSCPAVDGDMVQANTGGYYTIGCDDETTGYDVLVAAAPDFNDCMTYCDETSECTAWTYAGSCYLKTGTSASDFSFQPSSRRAISGIRNVPASGSSLSGTGTRASVTVSTTFVSQAAASTGPTNDEPVQTLMGSPMSSASLSIAEESSTSVNPAFTSVQTSEDNILSTTYQSITATPSPSGLDTSADLASKDTTSAASTVSTSDIALTAANSGIATDQPAAPQNSYSSSVVSEASVTSTTTLTSVADTTSLLTGTIILSSTSGAVSTTIAAASPSVTCSVFDNVLDICLDAVITPSVGAGGGINIGLGTSTITIVDISTSLAIAPSAAATADLGISVGSSGIGLGASASIGLNPGLTGSSQPATITSSQSASCSAGGNVLNICIDAAVTPSVGIGGNAGVGVGVGSSTITLVDISASLAVAPSVTAGVDLGLSIGSSGIGLIASATIGADLNLNSSGAITVGPLLPNVTASAGVALNLNLGSSSSALTLLAASVAVAASATAGLDLGLSVGSSGIGLKPSATLGLNLGLSAGLGGQSRPSSTSYTLSTVTSTNLALLPTSSQALLPGLGLGSNPSASTSLSSASPTSTTISSRSSSAPTRTTTNSTSTATKATSTGGLVQNLASALVDRNPPAHNRPNRRQEFTTLVRAGF
jgi:hypothetical protein